MSITVTLSHDKETLESLRDEWIDLQTRSSATGMALTWQWISIWYKYFGDQGQLWLLAARDNNRLIGIAPLMKVEEQPDRFFAWRQLEFIGTASDAEHLDFLIEAGYEEHVIPLLVDKLYEHSSQWDVIRLRGLCDTKTINILQRSDRNWIENPRKQMIAPYTTLPDTMEEWMLSVSSNHRQKLRRYRRKLDEQFPDGWSIKQVKQPDILDSILEHLVRLHQARWESEGGGNFYYGERTAYYCELMHSMLENGWLRLYHLDVEGETCAVYYCYHYRDRAYYEIGGVDRDVTDIPLGYILMQHGINEAINERLPEYTFMWGEFHWKYSFGGVNRAHRVFELIRSPRVQMQVKIVEVLREVKARLRQFRSQTGETASEALAEDID